MAYSQTKTFDHRKIHTQDGVSILYGAMRTGFRSGSRVPNFKQLIKESREATSGYSVEAFRYRVLNQASFKAKVKWIQDGSSSEINYTGYPGVNQNFFAAIPPFDDNRAISKLHQQLREHRSQMNGYLFLGELAETLKMLRSPADALVKGFFRWSNDIGRRLAKAPSLRHARNRRNLADTLAGTWLEASYGWAPFISDVGEIARTVGRIVVDREQAIDRITATATTLGTPILTVTEVVGVPPFMNTSPHKAYFTYDRRWDSESSTRYVIFLKGTCLGPIDSFSRLSQVTGFTFENVVPTVYNLIPYSFLLDYVSNLGECLEAQFTDVTTFSYGVCSQRSLSRVKTISVPNFEQFRRDYKNRDYAVVKLSGSTGDEEEIRTTLVRSRLTTFPTPNLELNLTSSWKKATNVLALLTSSLKAHRL